jgi:hypothetical protein
VEVSAVTACTECSNRSSTALPVAATPKVPIGSRRSGRGARSELFRLSLFGATERAVVLRGNQGVACKFGAELKRCGDVSLTALRATAKRTRGPGRKDGLREGPNKTIDFKRNAARQSTL